MIYDISFPLSPETMVYPGDPPFLREVLLDGAKGDDCTLSLLHLRHHFHWNSFAVHAKSFTCLTQQKLPRICWNHWTSSPVTGCFSAQTMKPLTASIPCPIPSI